MLIHVKLNMQYRRYSGTQVLGAAGCRQRNQFLRSQPGLIPGEDISSAIFICSRLVRSFRSFSRLVRSVVSFVSFVQSSHSFVSFVQSTFVQSSRSCVLFVHPVRSPRSFAPFFGRTRELNYLHCELSK